MIEGASRDEPQSRLVIGLDFGTTYSGVAWATPIDQQVHVSRDWIKDEQFDYSDQVITTISYFHDDPANRAWGYATGRLDSFKDQISKINPAPVTTTYSVPGVIRGCEGREDRSHRARLTGALADFCAKYNFLSASFASKLGLRIRAEEASNITIGSDKKVRTLGTATAQFAFQKEHGAYELIFHVLPNCVCDVVLGKSFLKASRTLTDEKNRLSRIKKTVGRALRGLQLCFLGDSAPYFTGSINGLPSKALADCGSNGLIMDRDYAISLGLDIDEESTVRLTFADGSTQYTTGIVRGVRWQFGPDQDASDYYLDFHVMESAPAPVILSDRFLFDDTEAYSAYSCYLLDGKDEDVFNEIDDGFFCHITIDEAFAPSGLIDLLSIPNRRHTEICLRSQNKTAITKLPLAEQAAARQAEEERQQKWQEEMDALERALLASAQQQALPDPLAAPAGQVPQPPSPPPKRRSFWLKLKRRKGQKPATTRP